MPVVVMIVRMVVCPHGKVILLFFQVEVRVDFLVLCKVRVLKSSGSR